MHALFVTTHHVLTVSRSHTISLYRGWAPRFCQLKRSWNTKKKVWPKVWLWGTRIFRDRDQQKKGLKKKTSSELKRSWNAICTWTNHTFFEGGCECRLLMGSPQHPPPDKSIPKTPKFGWNRVPTLRLYSLSHCLALSRSHTESRTFALAG